MVPRLVRLSLAFLFFLIGFTIHAQAPGDIHTFTGPNGQTLEAEVLDFVDRKVLIRRLSDGQSFELPADRLAPADVEYMRAWLSAREASKHPVDWKRLRIHVPEFADRVEAPGIPEAFRRVDLHTWEAELPEGAWIAIKLLRQPGSDFAPQFLLPFGGEREWFLSYEGQRLFRSMEANGEKVLAGFTILPDDGDAELRAMKKEIPGGSGISVYSGFLDEADFSNLGSGVISAVVKKMRSFAVAKGAKIRALRVTEAMNEFDGLAGFDELEMLEAPHSGDYPLSACAGLKGLTTLIADGDLDLGSASGDGVFPVLRHLSLSEAEIGEPDSLTAFLSRLRGLQSLSLPDEQALHMGALVGCPDLTVIHPGDECGDPGAEGLGALRNLTTVLLNENYTPADVAALVGKDALGKVRTLRTNHRIDFARMPQLKVLMLDGNRDGVDFSGLATPPGLAHLRIRGATDEDLAALGTAGSNLPVRSLTLDVINASALDALKSLPNLEFLNLESQYVTADQKLTAIDLSSFPSLRGLAMVQLQNLTEVTLQSGAKLEALTVRACGELARIQSPAIETLREVAISNCGALQSVGGLSEPGEDAIRRFTGSPRLK